MKRSFSILLVIVIAGCSVAGCATFGLPVFGDDPNRHIEQAALEFCLMAGSRTYLASDSELSNETRIESALHFALLTYDQNYPDLLGVASLPELLQKRLKDVARDKWNPQVMNIILIFRPIILEFLNKEGIEIDQELWDSILPVIQ